MRDTRIGCVVLVETIDVKCITEQVIHYVAKRIVKCQQMIEGSVTLKTQGFTYETIDKQRRRCSASGEQTWAVSMFSGCGLPMTGVAVGTGLMTALYWLKVTATGVSF